MGYVVKFILGKHKPDKMCEKEIYYYSHKKDAVNHFNSFKEDDSNLYRKIELIELANHREYILDQIDYENDWRRWKLGDELEYSWNDFDGSGSIEGIVTKVEEDHLIVTTSDNTNLLVDDTTSGSFIKLWQDLCNLFNFFTSIGLDPRRPVALGKTKCTKSQNLEQVRIFDFSKKF